MKHEVIVYSNPGEAAIWDWILNGSGGFFIVYVVALIISLFAASALADRYRWIERNKWTMGATVVGLSVVIYKALIWVLTYL